MILKIIKNHKKMASIEIVDQANEVSVPLNPYQRPGNNEMGNYNIGMMNHNENKNMGSKGSHKMSVYSLWLRSSSFLLFVY
jgi:hypothetical protein